MCVDVKTVKFIIRLENTSNKMQQRRKVKDPKIFLVEHVSGKTQWNFINNTKRIYNLNFVFTINLPWKNLDITKNVYFQFFDSQNTFSSNLNTRGKDKRGQEETMNFSLRNPFSKQVLWTCLVRKLCFTTMKSETLRLGQQFRP